MTDDLTSRRAFVSDAGRIASLAALGGLAPASSAQALSRSASSAGASAEWDLSWITTIERATDRAVFDWPSLGTPGADAIVLQIAERFLDNCATIYGTRAFDARAVLNIRTQAVPAALGDALWGRYQLGVEYKVNDLETKEAATRNPFMQRVPDFAPGVTLPSLADLLRRGSIVLVCDFALGHLARRLATKAGRGAEEVHNELRGGLVPGAFLVPSGIFGLARAQNSGCAYVRM